MANMAETTNGRRAQIRARTLETRVRKARDERTKKQVADTRRILQQVDDERERRRRT
jgi:hypothetical protein